MSTSPLPDANAQQALLEQLADASQRNADMASSLDSAFGALRVRLAELEELAREREQSERRRSEQLERLGGEVERLRADQNVSGQLEALGAQQVRLADRAEQLTTELRRVDQLQASLAQMGRELTSEIASRDHALRAELQAQGRLRAEEGERLGRTLQSLIARDEQVGAQGRTLESLGRQQTELLRAMEAHESRLDGFVAALAAREEAARQLEQRLRGSSMELQARLQDLTTTVSHWQGRLDEQTETLREARGLVDQAGQEANRLRVEHHATLEALRVGGERMDGALAILRQEIAARWEQFLAGRRQDWTTLSQERGVEQRAVADALAALRGGIDAELALLAEGLSAGLELGRQDMDSLRHRMGLFIRGLREAVLAGAESLDVDLPSSDPGAQSPERRQALRRALRARRQAGGGP